MKLLNGSVCITPVVSNTRAGENGGEGNIKTSGGDMRDVDVLVGRLVVLIVVLVVWLGFW